MTPTAPQHRINYGTALASLGMPNEQKVLFADAGWANRVFTKVIVDLGSAVIRVAVLGFPAGECVINGLVW